jgi:flagellar motor switch protein FliN/FliY
MPSDAVDSFFVELINAAAEVAYSLSVGEKPNILYVGSDDIKGSDIGNLMSTDLFFRGKFDGIFDGRFLVDIPDSLAKPLSGTLIGSGLPETIGSAEKSALNELMNNILARWSSIWSDTLGRDVMVREGEIVDPGSAPPPPDEPWVEMSAGVAVGTMESTMRALFPTAMIDIVDKKIGPSISTVDMERPTITAKPKEAEQVEIEDEAQEEDLNIRQAQFQQLKPSPVESQQEKQIDLILDVPLLISVELGRKDLTIREILELSPGSLIELNQLAGEPVDLLINGKLFARGEVVVIDENFGIRVTHIISPQERVEKLR